jgi:hypothetical protein
MIEEHHAARPHPEHVVLEIGEELGALVLYTEPGMHGCEIEISLAGDDEGRSHKEVLNRPVGGRPTYAAVFDGLREGSYTLWSGDVAAARGVAVAGASITELDWRGAAAPSVPLVRHGH